MQTRYEIILSAVDRGVKAAFRGVQEGVKKGGESLGAYNQVMGRSEKITGALTRQIKGLVAAYVGFQTVSSTLNILRDSETAMFNLSMSVEAAEKEFGDSLGTIDQWEAKIKRLGNRLTIFSKTDLRTAASMTIDMTKRYGLAADQMEELIARAGDLAAGKMGINEAVNAVTAALRGQSDQAERLGLILNESYTKAWYEANNAQGKAWTSLTNVEKAQARFQLMLVQTQYKMGNASKSAEIWAGAITLVKSALSDAIAESDGALSSLDALAKVIRENSDELGEMAGYVVSLTASVVELTVEWRKEIAAFLGTALAYVAVRRLILIIKELKTVIKALIVWGGKLVAAIKAVVTAVAIAAGGSMAALVGALVAIPAIIGAVVWSLALLYEGWTRNRESAQKLEKTLTDLKKKHEDFRDVKIPADIASLAREDLEKLNNDLHRAQAYYRILKIELEEKSKKTNIFGQATEEAIAAQQELKNVEARLKEIKSAIRGIDDVPVMEEVKKEVMATADELENFRKSAEEAYKHASSEAEKYAGKIRDLNHGMADRERSLQDRIREMRRKNMDEEVAANDLRANAVEKERAAREALARFRASGDEREMALAREMAKEADQLWSEYARGGESATNLAISGLERVNKLLDEADKEDIGLFEKMQKDAESAMVEITKQLDKLTEARDLDVTIKLKELEAAQKKINALIKDETKTIFIQTVPNEAHGGRVGMAKGGRFPGDSKIDSIPVMARPGEGFVRNESLKIWDRLFGTGFFEGVNNPRSAAGQAIIRALQGKISLPPMPKTRVSPGLAFAAGGRVPAMGGFDMSRMGTVDLTMDGTRYPVAGNRDVLEELTRAIARKKHRRPQ